MPRLPTHALATRVADVYLAQRSLGCDVTQRAGLSLSRNAATPLIYDANFAFAVEAELAADGPTFEAALADAFADARHQKVVCEAGGAPIVEARLSALGFDVEQLLHMVLPGPLAAAPPLRGPVALHEATTEADWAALVRLQRSNFDERATRQGQPPFEPAVAEQMVASWRMKPGMRRWLAHDEGTGPCAYLGSWVGQGGLGMVEDLFTEPAQRHRGIATALIDRAVREVRAEGAEAVLIGAEVEDTPKKMYLDLGFRPVCITREWLRTTNRG